MIQSMTGYAVASAESPRGALTLELRSVNSRFLDLQFRVAEELRAAEPMLRELISAQARARQGGLPPLLAATPLPSEQQLNVQAIEQLRGLAAERSQGDFRAPRRCASPTCCAGPGVLAEPAADEERTRAALEQLGRRRARRALRRARPRRREARRDPARPRPPRCASGSPKSRRSCPRRSPRTAARLAERLREVLGAGAEERIRAEIALFAAKSDVDEEITRLAAHLDEVERVTNEGKCDGRRVGKRLDFLAQELNREANTLASKAAGLKIADCALELKLLIEQIREQVQNIE